VIGPEVNDCERVGADRRNFILTKEIGLQFGPRL